MECETGRIGVYLYGEAFSRLRPKERIWEADLADIVLGLASDTSYEKATMYLNRFLHRSKEDALCKKTVEEFVERTGKDTDSAYARRSDAILSNHGIDTATGIPGTDAKIPAQAIAPSGAATADKEAVEALARRYNEGREERLRIPKPFISVLPEGRPDDCIYVYIDDVLTKHQKECRSPGSRRTTKFVATTVISIQHGDSKYNIATDGMQEAFRRLMAFLLANSLMEDRQLIFITDGATEIKEHVQRYFGFRPYTLHLDWHHLQKKCYQLMSSALKGGKKMKQEKDAIERELYGILWTGNVKGALDYIAGISQKNIKSQEALDLLKGLYYAQAGTYPLLCHQKGSRTAQLKQSRGESKCFDEPSPLKRPFSVSGCPDSKM